MPLRSRIGLRSLVRRIQKLEVRFLPKPIPYEPPTEYGLKLQEAMGRLLERMEPEQRRLVHEDLAALPNDWEGLRQYKMLDLTYPVIRYARAHLDSQTPLELPAAVLSVYLQDSDARPEHECAECGYDLPYTKPSVNPQRAEIIYFQNCPLCGGAVGREAFHNKHKFFKSHRPVQEEQTIPTNS